MIAYLKKVGQLTILGASAGLCYLGVVYRDIALIGVCVVIHALTAYYYTRRKK